MMLYVLLFYTLLVMYSEASGNNSGSIEVGNDDKLLLPDDQYDL